jgi:hypothetical protein
MTSYTVHLYREMRLVFQDINAATHQEAARLASAKATNDAQLVEDCEGFTYSALVDPEGGDPSDESQIVHLRADGGEIEPAPERVTNAHRAKWAEACVSVFIQHTGCDNEDALGDLLCDLMHWAVQRNFALYAALESALGHFEAELVEEGQIAPPPPARDGRGRLEHAATPLLGTLFHFFPAQEAETDATREAE